jgi:hypothetical protein
MPFALATINYLYSKKGSAPISQAKFMEFLGYANKTQAAKYRDILLASGLLTAGRTYSAGRNAKRYTLTPETKAEIAKHLQEEVKAG